MTETQQPRTFTEGEAYALVNDAVARETASISDRATAAESSNTELQNKIDVLETEKAAEKSRADAAEQALTDYKTQVETEKAREALRSTRLAQVAEASPVLDVTDTTDEGKARAERIVAMTDEVFTGYLTDVKAASKAPAAAPAVPGAAPRQSAALGGEGSESSNKSATVLSVLGARRNLTKTA